MCIYIHRFPQHVAVLFRVDALGWAGGPLRRIVSPADSANRKGFAELQAQEDELGAKILKCLQSQYIYIYIQTIYIYIHTKLNEVLTEPV